MLVKTGGIVIKNTKYSDSSIITKIYTRSLGMQTYMIHGIHSAKAAIKPSLLQPLVLLDLVVYSNPIKNIQRIKEAIPNPTLRSLHFDVVKSTIGLFVAELLHRAVKEEEPNERLYNFVEKFIIYTDDAEINLSVLPLFFVLQMTRFLGFFPQADTAYNYEYFNLTDGVFTEQQAAGVNNIEPQHATYLHKLLTTNFDTLPQARIPKASRTVLLNKIMDYYILHIPGFSSLRSLPVLASLLKED
ncbi:MAG: DNA repair protein RecO [Sphingobacteriales bacterium]|nr:MAG: DNA repair protein RecO [Sphingobacteriales bacterium]